MFIAGTDFEKGPLNVTIPKGERIADYCFDIINDTMLEDDKAFVLQINSNTLHSDIVLMDPEEATITIKDDECKHNNCTCQYYV